jgi:XTP/dITP diphosphohydrolase
MQILFATNNRNKRQEVQSLLPANMQLLTLGDAGVTAELPEPYESLEENARSKIRFALQRSGLSAGFSEDSGLFIEALGGKPGVHSAHYAGPQRVDADNIQRVLLELEGLIDRTAYFQTTICLIWMGKEYFFHGICPGSITQSTVGHQGFGYDPIFQPAGSDRTFGEMELIEKNGYSHRQKAMQQMIQFLHQTKKLS